MRVDLFDFELPRALIADRPAEPRDAARLLVVAETLADHQVTHLPTLLRCGDLLIVNDTKVIPARLHGRRGLAEIELALHRDMGGGIWRAFAKGARRLRPGDPIAFSEGFSAAVIEKGTEGDVVLRF